MISALGAVYRKEALKGVQDFLLSLLIISTFCSLPDIDIAAYENVWLLYGKVL